MRIPSTKIWLATALTLGIGLTRAVANPALNFNDDDFSSFGNVYDDKGNFIEAPVLNLEDLKLSKNEVNPSVSRIFNWTTTRQIQTVKLFVQNQKSEEIPIAEKAVPNMIGATPDHTTPSFMQPTTPARKRAPSPEEAFLGDARDKRQTNKAEPGQHIVLDVVPNPAGGSVTIIDVRLLQSWSGRPLYFGALWPVSNGNVSISYSRAFAVADNRTQALSIIDAQGSRYRDPSPFRQDAENSSASPTSSGSGAATPLFTSVATTSASSEESPGGLATGAIAGIAVACGILGLLLILGGIWFLIRRRNKQAGNTNYGSPGRPYGTERSRTDDLIAEKEASAGGADPSPHSPYSDDGVVLVPSTSGPASSYHNRGSNGAIAMGTPVAAPILPQQIPQRPQLHDHHHQQAGPYPTYSERGSIGALGGGGGGSPSTHAASITHSTHDETTSRAGMGSPTAGRATPHSSLAPQYAHLVEEGMTEDEIRRLEDEERQLDAEIERAGRR